MSKWNWETNELNLRITNHEPWYRERNNLANDALQELADWMENAFMAYPELSEYLDTYLIDWEEVAIDALKDLPDLQ